MSNNEHRLSAADIIADIASDLVERLHITTDCPRHAAAYTYWADAVSEVGMAAAYDLLSTCTYAAICRVEESDAAR